MWRNVARRRVLEQKVTRPNVTRQIYIMLMEIEYENEEQPFEDEFEDELDDDWIKLIEEEEKEYTTFYRESNDMIKIFFTVLHKIHGMLWKAVILSFPTHTMLAF